MLALLRLARFVAHSFGCRGGSRGGDGGGGGGVPRVHPARPQHAGGGDGGRGRVGGVEDGAVGLRARLGGAGADDDERDDEGAAEQHGAQLAGLLRDLVGGGVGHVPDLLGLADDEVHVLVEALEEALVASVLGPDADLLVDVLDDAVSAGARHDDD